jgi:hypothetical protein
MVEDLTLNTHGSEGQVELDEEKPLLSLALCGCWVIDASRESYGTRKRGTAPFNRRLPSARDPKKTFHTALSPWAALCC